MTVTFACLCFWLTVFGDRMLEPGHFQFEASLPIIGHFCLPFMSALFFSLPSLGRGMGPDQG